MNRPPGDIIFYLFAIRGSPTGCFPLRSFACDDKETTDDLTGVVRSHDERLRMNVGWLVL